jgi:prefoldin alpha subunit|tara:strand:+ start:39405 stop:39833 length:429 start_codon:yes stop_codon:yes gene_type:complete
MTDQQKAYMELQSIEQQSQQVQEQLQTLQQQLLGLNELSDNLEEFAKLKPGSEMFSALGSGIYISAELRNTDQVITNVGAGVAVKKSIPEAKKSIEKQIVDITDVQSKVQQNMQKMAARAQELQTQLAMASPENTDKTAESS